MFPQKLLEECDRNKEKVEECQRYAKQYIDAIKVRCGLAPPGCRGGRGDGEGQPGARQSQRARGAHWGCWLACWGHWPVC